MGDDLDVIASGPTVPDTSTWQDVKAILERYGLPNTLPKAVVKALDEGLAGIRPETPKPKDPAFERCTTMLVGTNYQALCEAVEAARTRGYHTLLLGSRFSGEAREIGKVFSGIAQDIALHGTPIATPACIIAGGETTVTLRGSGKGGRNQEMALAVLNEFSHLSANLRAMLGAMLFCLQGQMATTALPMPPARLRMPKSLRTQPSKVCSPLTTLPLTIPIDF